MGKNDLLGTLLRGLSRLVGLAFSVAVVVIILALCLAGWGRLMDATDELGMDPARARFYRAGEELPPPDLSAFAPEERLVANSLGMMLALIPPGEFIMGSPPSEFGRSQYELPHRVRITRPFYLAVHEVTVAQFRRFVTETGYRPYRASYSARDSRLDYSLRLSRPAGTGALSWDNPGFPQREDHPVVNVSWTDAVAFSRWLSEKENHTYRLPTEAEWEYACRAGTTRPYSMATSGTAFANVREIAADHQVARFSWLDGFKYTAPVGSFPPNPLGLCDMHGNVGEYCSDYYQDSYYRSSPVCDPRCGDVHEKGGQDARRVLRGGAWDEPLYYARSASRTFCFESAGAMACGFRVARSYAHE